MIAWRWDDFAINVVGPLTSAAIGAVFVLVVRRWPWARDRLIFRPLRRAGDRSGLVSEASALQAALSAEPHRMGAAVVIEAMRHGDGVDDRRGAIRHAGLLRSLTDPGSAGIFTRLLFREEEADVRLRAASAAAALEPFESAVPVAAKAIEAGFEFGRWATEMSGAPVLLDSLDSRSRVAHDVLVWHKAEYRGHPLAVGRSYTGAHRAGCPASMENPKAGDYDGRVLILEACDVEQEPETGKFSFVLETSESCYAATEQGANLWGCKHIPSEPRSAPEMRFVRSNVLRRTGSRLCMLTSYTVVLTSDRQFVLTRRSKEVRSGPGTLSASAGGVCEPGPGDPTSRGDRDDHGWPDPLRSAQRELHEELGLSVERERIEPVALFLANSTNDDDGGRGQLVASLLSIVRVLATFAEIEQTLWTSSALASGRFEVDDLIGIPMIGTSTEFAEQLAPHAGDLDQHGLLAAIYASAAVFGRKDTRSAFSSVLAAHSDTIHRRRLFEPGELVPHVIGRPTSTASA